MNVSVPSFHKTPARALTEAELHTALAVAAALIPAGSAGPAPGQLPDYRRWLQRALAARSDAFDQITATLTELADRPRAELLTALRSRHEQPGVRALTSVIAGAYLMTDEVRERIGYPGQHPNPPAFDEAAEQITDGILDPVIARGSTTGEGLGRRGLERG
jgi:hypothetical protein